MDLPYIPAENSPTRQQMQSGGGSDSEDDPLDAFMAEVEVRRELQARQKEIRIRFQMLNPRFFLNFFSPPEPSSQRHEETRGKGKGEKVSQVRLKCVVILSFV